MGDFSLRLISTFGIERGKCFCQENVKCSELRPQVGLKRVFSSLYKLKIQIQWLPTPVMSQADIIFQ